MTDIWTGAGVWAGWKLTTNHSASSYGQPVLVDPDGNAYGPGDIAAPLVGLKEAAAILGWDPRKVATYRSRGVFPAPAAELASGPVWTRQQIEEYKTRKEEK